MRFSKIGRIFAFLIIVITIGIVTLIFTNRGIFKDKMPSFLRKLSNKSSLQTLELQGNVEIREVRLGFEVPGRIAEMLVDEGDKVVQGQLLAKLKSDYFEDAVKQAEAILEARKAEFLKLENGPRPEEIEQAKANTLAAKVAFLNAQKEYLRAQKLVSSGAISRKVFDNAKAARDQAEAKLKAAQSSQKLIELGPRKEEIAKAKALVKEAQARLNEARRKLADTQLNSSVNGIIQIKVHEVGDYVYVGEPVYIISITNPVWVRAYVNEIDLGRIRPGMKAIVRTDAGKTFEGKIGFISPVAEFTPKTVQTKEIRTDLVYRIRIVVQDPKNDLRQGMPVSVFIDLQPKDR